MLLLALDMAATLVLPLLVVGVVFLVLFLLLLLGGVRVRGVSMWSFVLLFILVVGLVRGGLLAGRREDRVVEEGWKVNQGMFAISWFANLDRLFVTCCFW